MFGLIDVVDIVVTFGGVEVIVDLVDSEVLIVVVMILEYEFGMVDVMLINSMGSEIFMGAYIFELMFYVLIVNLVSGFVDGGTNIMIYGVGFVEGVEVRVGVLFCNVVTVVDEIIIQCIIFVGSLGAVDVMVIVVENEVILFKGFFYEFGGMEFFVIDPNMGSQVGGTFVCLLGVGFEELVKVIFGELLVLYITLVSSMLIIVKILFGEIGTIDVMVEVGYEMFVLIDGFTYFNFMSFYGGTWGLLVDGVVNVMVLDVYEGFFIFDVFVMFYINLDIFY